MYIGKQKLKRRIYTAMKQSKDSGLRQRKLPNLPTFRSELKLDFAKYSVIKRRHTQNDLFSLRGNLQRRLSGVTPEIIEKIKSVEREQDYKQLKMEAVRRHANYDEEIDITRQNIALVEGTSQRIAGIIDVFQDEQGFWIRKLEITKVPGQGLGFFIKKGNGFDRKNGVFISRVSLGSVLDVYGLLHTGDEVLEVNRVNLRGFPLEDVALMMQIPDKLMLTTKSRVAMSIKSKKSNKSVQKNNKNSQKEKSHDKLFKQLSSPDKNTDLSPFEAEDGRLFKSLTHSSPRSAKFFTRDDQFEAQTNNNAHKFTNRSHIHNLSGQKKQKPLESNFKFPESPDSGIEAPASADNVRNLPDIPIKSSKSPRKLPTPPPVSGRKASNDVFDSVFDSNGVYSTASKQLPSGFKRAELYRVKTPEQEDGAGPSKAMTPSLTLDTATDDLNSSSQPETSFVKDPRRTFSVTETSKNQHKMGFFRAFTTTGSQKSQKGHKKDSKPEPERLYEPYQSDDLNSEMEFTKAFSGMLSVHIDKATRVKQKSSKDLFYCTIEIDDEFKASTSKKNDSSSQGISFDEQFDIEISHASELTIYIFEIGPDKQHSLSSNGVVFLEKVLRGSSSRSIALVLEGSGVLNISLDFTEAVKYLKRTPSSRNRGVFGFNIVSTLDEERNTIPMIVRKCVDEIEKRGMHIVGIYRVSGNAKKKRLLKADFDQDSGSVNVSEDSGIDCNVLSGIIKDYLRELPEPLIPESVLQQILEAKNGAVSPNMNKRQNILGGIIRKLPYGSRATLIYIMDHLIRVQENKDVNKMDITNLSVCFGPVLMCPATSKDVLDFKKINDALEYLLKIWPKNHERGVEIEITNM